MFQGGKLKLKTVKKKKKEKKETKAEEASELPVITKTAAELKYEKIRRERVFYLYIVE